MSGRKINLREWLKSNDSLGDAVFRKTILFYCQSVLGGIWMVGGLNDVKIEKLSGGTINTILLVTLSSSLKPLQSEPLQVVFRIYCVPERSYVSETVIGQILADHHLGPKLYGILDEGRIEEYIPGDPITMMEARILPIAKEIARTFAKLHKIEAPVSKLPGFMDFIDEWYANLCSNPKAPSHFEIPEWYQAYAPKELTLDRIKSEIEFIRSKLPKLIQNVVFCHNDLLGGNILLYRDNPPPLEMPLDFKPKLMFIDFEFAGYNPRGFDLADHFAKYAYDYGVENPPYTDPKKFASIEQMMNFMIAYVDEAFPEMPEVERRKEAESLLKETMTFLPISPFFWAGYMINHVLNHPSTFDAYSLALERFGIYFMQKHLLEELFIEILQ